MTISCASIPKVPAERVTVPPVGAASIAAWMAWRVAAEVAAGWTSAKAEAAATGSEAAIKSKIVIVANAAGPARIASRHPHVRRKPKRIPP